MSRSLYPPNWDEISLYIRTERAGDRCEGSPGIYPDCRAENRKPHPVTRSVVMLTVSHLDHQPWNNDPANLRAMCQRCHLAYDEKHHLATWRYGRIAAGQRFWDWAPEGGPPSYRWALGQAESDIFHKWVAVQVNGA